MRDGDGDELALGKVGNVSGGAFGQGAADCRRGGGIRVVRQLTRRLELGTVGCVMDPNSATATDFGSVRAVDITFRARQEECEYLAVFRVNPVEVRGRTVVFYVDHASLIAMFRAAEPRGDDFDAESSSIAALDGIGIDHEFLVARRDGDDGAMFRELARLALDWWFDEFERDASPITLGNARLVGAVVDTALAEESPQAPKNHTLATRRFEWREVAAAGPLRPA